jgi:hypothetical protein
VQQGQDGCHKPRTSEGQHLCPEGVLANPAPFFDENQ